jgi:WD40 repeat protein/serine/threonine protein kinase
VNRGVSSESDSFEDAPTESLVRADANHDQTVESDTPNPLRARPDEGSLIHAVEMSERYEEIREHGRGGLGRILLVHDRLLGRNVALKELLPNAAHGRTPALSDIADASVPADTRFLREARITSQLEHPGIVPVYEMGQRQDGTPYYTMKLVRGETFTNAINAAGSLQQRLDLLPHFGDVCHAVAYAHSRGVVHRDLKPSNIMVGAFGETIVLDWGLAKSRGEEDVDPGIADSAEEDAHDERGIARTAHGEILGTPAYMAPEQARGDVDRVDERTDVYALGAVMYALLTGQEPFTGHNVKEVVARVVKDRPEPCESLEPDAPPELAAICRRAMRKNPEDRYQTARELAKEVHLFQTGSFVAAYHYTRVDRARHFVREHRVGLAAAALVLLVLVVSGVGSFTAILNEQARTEQELYYASLHLAQNAIEHNRLLEARQALFNAPSHHRSCEWGLLQNLTHLDLIRIRGHGDRVEHASFSPDGEWIITASDDGTAKLWRAGTGEEVATFDGEAGHVEKAVFSRNGTHVVTSHGDGFTRVWDLGSGRTMLQVEGDAVALSPDGKCIATAGGPGGWAASYDLVTGQEQFRLEGHGDIIDCIAFSDIGERIATGSRDQTARIWNTTEGKELQTLTGHTGAVRCVAFGPEGDKVVTASDDGLAKLWDIETGQEVLSLEGHTDYVWCAAFTPDGQRIVTASEDRTIRVWETSSGKPLQQIDGFSRPPRFLALNPNGTRLITEGRTGDALVLSLLTTERYATLDDHTGSVNAVAFSPDGTLLATGGGHLKYFDDDRVILWDVKTGENERELAGQGYSVNAVAFFPEGKRLASGDAGGSLAVWDLRTGRRAATVPAHTDQIRSLAISPGGESIATASWDGTAKVWDSENGQLRATLRSHEAPVDSVAFSPLGNRIATGGRDATARIWDADTAHEIMVLEVGGQWVWCLAFSFDGKTLATGDRHGGITLWDLKTGRRIIAWKGHRGNRVHTMVFTRDGRRLLTGGRDSTVRVWDAATGREVLMLTEHSGPVMAAAFSADERYLATGAHPSTAILWPVFPWRDEDYPGSKSQPFEERVELYKRQLLGGSL